MRKYPGRVQVTIDRPIGYIHHGTTYTVNYGFVVGIIGGDGDEQDVYVLGVNIPLEQFEGKLVAVVHRSDDVETKWIVTPDGVQFSASEIMQQIHFIEQYFDAAIELL